VRLQDMNDHAPTFSSSLYNVSIDECLPVHTSVTRLSSRDLDQGRNAETVYSIVGGSGLFAVNPTTGLLSVAGVLDTETMPMVDLVIQAQDRANNGSKKVKFIFNT